MAELNISPYGPSGVLVRGLTAEQILHLESLSFPHAELRAGLDSLLVTWDTNQIHRDHLLATIERALIPHGTLGARTTRSHVIAARWDGEDLLHVAHQVDLDENELIAQLLATEFEVALVGFAPGFPYLVPSAGSPVSQWTQIPRLAVPRTSVPKGAIGVAAGMACVYPQALPGGWNLIGTTEVELFDATSAKPSLLQRGDRIRFITKDNA